MKKNAYLSDVISVGLGLVFLVVALTTETRLESLLWGMVGGFGVAGVLRLCHRHYWSRPERREIYEARQRKAVVDSRDERTIMLRHRSGWAAYVLMTVLYCGLLFLASILSLLDVAQPYTRFAMFALAILLVIQVLLGWVLFRHYERRF